MQHIIYPYWDSDLRQWAFDDEDVGLDHEPFVEGSSEVLTALVEALGIPTAKENGFVLCFSTEPLGPDQAVIHLVEQVNGGAVYETAVAGQQMRGWLCPNLMRYFDRPPQRIYLDFLSFGGPK